MTNWTISDIPAQKGRSAVVTGTGGLGYEDALELARAGADVIIAGRSPEKGAEAVARIRAELPSATVRFEELDLASLESVSSFAARLKSQKSSLDLLINNAAVMVPPRRQETSDGLELQFGTNYLGHFALTAQLMPLLRKSTSARVVTLSSVASRDGKINFADLQEKQSYVPMRAYGQSKLACLMFALELQRRSDAGQWGVASIAAHPGISRTQLLHNAPGKWSAVGLTRTLLWFLFQPASRGALPTLYAATSPAAVGGAYYGPHAMSETRGHPALAKIPQQAADTAVAQRLWRVSEQLSGLAFDA
ncbi:oxidoreductase [Sandaracinus amylolyticus]|uniref:oxidoreductase n=1 Tax=Sandaracinus amylolyticus TaxID=927083 RepID=UPI003AF35111